MRAALLTILVVMLAMANLPCQQQNSQLADMQSSYWEDTFETLTYAFPCITTPQFTAGPYCLFPPSPPVLQNVALSLSSITAYPYEIWVSGGPPDIGAVTGPFGSIDLSFAPHNNLQMVACGILNPIQPGLAAVSFHCPNPQPQTVVTIQGFVIEPSAPGGFWASAAHYWVY